MMGVHTVYYTFLCYSKFAPKTKSKWEKGTTLRLIFSRFEFVFGSVSYTLCKLLKARKTPLNKDPYYCAIPNFVSLGTVGKYSYSF